MFAAAYLVRVGLQDGLDFGGIDPMPGAFGDHDPSRWRVASCIVWKYVGTSLLLGWLVLRRTGRFSRHVIALVTVLAVGRELVLALTLFSSRDSLRSSLRVFSDLPCAAATALAALIGLFVVARSSSPARALAQLPARASGAEPRLGVSLDTR
ncbi:MAG: hypothetical protein ABI175_13390 [Polyangiales bacterium]